jgi:hypothetical protein
MTMNISYYLMDMKHIGKLWKEFYLFFQNLIQDKVMCKEWMKLLDRFIIHLQPIQISNGEVRENEIIYF